MPSISPGTSSNTAIKAKPNSELTYPERAQKYAERLKKEVTPSLKSKLKIFLIERMEKHGYRFSDQLSEADFDDALTYLYSQATPEEITLLELAGFEKVGFFISAVKAAGKIKALIPVLYEVLLIGINAGWYEYEKLRAMPEPPEEVSLNDDVAYIKALDRDSFAEKVQNFVKRRKDYERAYYSTSNAFFGNSIAKQQEKWLADLIIDCINGGYPKTLSWLIAQYELTCLDLRDAGIHFDGRIERSGKLTNSITSETLFQALEICPKVTKLDISNPGSSNQSVPKNSFSLTGAQAFSVSLGLNRTLTAIDLSGNDILKSGYYLRDFASGAFFAANRLTSITLKNISIDIKGGEEEKTLLEYFKENKNITEFVADFSSKEIEMDVIAHCKQNEADRELVYDQKFGSIKLPAANFFSKFYPDEFPLPHDVGKLIVDQVNHPPTWITMAAMASKREQVEKIQRLKAGTGSQQRI